MVKVIDYLLRFQTIYIQTLTLTWTANALPMLHKMGKKSKNKSFKELTSVFILDILHGHIDRFYALNRVLILCIRVTRQGVELEVLFLVCRRAIFFLN